jgi:hypothetical protein
MGIFLSMKLTNLPFIIPLLLLFVIKHRKTLQLKTVLCCIVCGLLPVSIYLIYAYMITGNPVFPFYNQIFMSEYYPLLNFKDARWGPSNLKEFILWYPHAILWPWDRLTEIPYSWPYPFALTILSGLRFVVGSIRDKKRLFSPQMQILYLLVISMFLWSGTTGYIRYFMVGALWGNILSIMFICELARKKFPFKTVIVTGLIFVLALQPILSFREDVIGREWGWRAWDKSVYERNLKYVFHDYHLADEQKDKIDMFILLEQYGGIAHLIKPDIPIIYFQNVILIRNDEIREEIYNRVDKAIEEGQGVYTLGRSSPAIVALVVKAANAQGFYISEVEPLQDYFEPEESFVLYKLTMPQPGQENQYDAEKNTVNQWVIN